MKPRALLYAICLLTVGAGGVQAQAPAPGPNSPPIDSPKLDGTKNTPNTTGTPIPEVVQPTSQHGDVIQPKSTEDPTAVLKPPNVDPKMSVDGTSKKADPK
jgi:hypothetical protein